MASCQPERVDLLSAELLDRMRAALEEYAALRKLRGKPLSV
jgi:hypothetical protein